MSDRPVVLQALLRTLISPTEIRDFFAGCTFLLGVVVGASPTASTAWWWYVGLTVLAIVSFLLFVLMRSNNRLAKCLAFWVFRKFVERRQPDKTERLVNLMASHRKMGETMARDFPGWEFLGDHLEWYKEIKLK
jgi:hypothetical protein